MLETVKIRRAGFPVRRTFRDFLSRLASLICYHFNQLLPFCFLLLCLNFISLPIRYKIIMKDRVPAAADDKKKSTDLLIKYDKTKKEWQLGKTKVSGLIKLLPKKIII